MSLKQLYYAGAGFTDCQCIAMVTAVQRKVAHCSVAHCTLKIHATVQHLERMSQPHNVQTFQSKHHHITVTYHNQVEVHSRSISAERTCMLVAAASKRA
eukprot:15328-Heterococcus_DN1.PRE.1